VNYLARTKEKKDVTRSDGLYEAKITLTYPNGRKLRKSFYSDISLKHAREKGTAYQNEITIAGRLGLGKTDNDILFNDWCQKYLENYKLGKVSDATYYSMEKRCEKYIYPYFKNVLIKSIKPIHLQSFFDSKEIVKKSSAIKEKIKFILNGSFEAALDNDIILRNPIRNLVLPEYKKVIEKYIYSEEEQKIIIDYIKLHDCDKSIAILLKTGLRRGELLALEWNDINFDNLTITINKAIKDTAGKPIVGKPKTKAGNRIIIFDNELKDILLSINRTRSFTKERVPVTIESKYVIPNKYGELYLTSNWYKRVYKPLLDEIVIQNKDQNMKPLTPHELRHSYGTTLYDRGVDLRTIQKIMGHATLEITSNLYIHDNIETMRKSLKYD